MRQAGVYAPADIAGEREAWDEIDERSVATSGGEPSVTRRARQPAPDPIAFEVAERYAKALTLDASAPAPPAPAGPRRSRAAMRDRALDASRPADRAARSDASIPVRRAPDRAARSNAPVRAGRVPAADRPARRDDAPVHAGRSASGRAPAARPRLAVAPAPRHAPRDAPRIPPPPLSTESAVPPPARRTVTIRGRGAERAWSPSESRRRPAVPAHERPGFRPDRAALWAVVLGLLLVLVAATSSHAAVLAHAIR